MKWALKFKFVFKSFHIKYLSKYIVNDIIGGDTAIIRKASEEFVAFQARNGVLYTEVRYDLSYKATQRGEK